MIIIAFFAIVVDAIIGLLGMIPMNISTFEVNDSVYLMLAQILNLVDYFVPLGELLPIIIFFLAADAGIFSWRVLMRIKSFIPTMGN